MPDIKSLIDNEKIINWRRALHQIPETAFVEYKTTEYILRELSAYPELEIFRPAKTGVLAVLRGGLPGKVTGLRADIDALPVQEETGLGFASIHPGKMHACGHDAHAAMLLGALDALYKMRDKLPGTVKFIFQHAEELYPGGARDFIASGLLVDVSRFYASHVFCYDVAGKISSASGAVSAATDSFYIKIQGRGSHGSKPEDSVDSALIAAELVCALHHIVSRNVSPFEQAVVSVGRLKAGDIFNVIPDTAEIDGTVRSFRPAVRDLLEARIRETTNGICAAYGAAADIRYVRGYSPVVNNAACVELVKRIAEKRLGEGAYFDMPAQMIGEDFFAYGALAPAVFVNLLAGFPEKERNYMNHHPRFDINEDALAAGAEMYAAFALE